MREGEEEAEYEGKSRVREGEEEDECERKMKGH